MTIMKNKNYVICLFTLLLTGFTAHSQVYKTPADTAKLNKEFTEVSNDIAILSAKLTVAQNNMPGYQSKAKTAHSDAQDAAASSSAQAAKSTEGGVKEARNAKRKSKKAYREAKDARSANNVVENQDDKIVSLTGQLAKKQERLRQLTEMRDAINALTPQQ
jgi:chemotaxis protein histidine kinase CheA